MAERGERGTGGKPSHSGRVKLAELGVSEKESSRFQQVVAVQQKQFDAVLAEAHERGGDITVSHWRHIAV